MKTLNDLKVSKKTKEKIYQWLDEWLELFIKNADGRTGNVFRADFENNDFFYFTECNDILINDPESESVETNIDIRRRKRNVMMQILIRTLKGEKLGKQIKCTHCGYEYCSIQAVFNGHYVYCPHCKKIKLTGYLPSFMHTAGETFEQLIETKEV